MDIQNVFNRPPSISEDTLQYDIYPAPENSDRAAVTTFAVAIQSYVDSVLQDFLWHRDPFELKVVQDPDSDGWMLSGRMRVGDSIDDEWATVWLLREISAKWDLAVSVYDSDGDFMLIEAAEVLPRWVTPSNTENRVWIYKSHLHLIPLSHISSPSSKRRRRALPGARENEDQRGILNDGDDDFLGVPDALKLLRDPTVRTQASAEVEDVVWQRISGYPAALKEHIHKTKAFVPVDIAKALAADPSLVQRAVETFYTRDDVQLRAAQRMSRFPPEPCTLKNIKLTRTAYAQLAGQKFHPPRVFGRWTEREGTPQWKWRAIGMKIAVGFEMLYQESKGRAEGAQATRDSVQSSAEARKDALRRDPEYVKYIQSLQSAGYFQGEVEGSQLWNQLEAKAVDIFVQTRRADDASRPSFAASVNTAILHAPPDAVQPSDEPEDSDEWLNISSEDLDNVLQRKLGKATDSAGAGSDAMDVDQPKQELSEEDRTAKEEAKRLQSLAMKVEDFLKAEGDIEGARFEDEKSSDDEMSEFSDEASADGDSESDAGNGDKKAETTAEKAARQEAMDRLVPGIDPSEYGRMPVSYSTSQRVARTTVETEVVEEVVSVAASQEEQLRQKPVRAPIIMRDRYEGVDSDDETDEEEAGIGEDEEEEEDQPQVVGEIEVDMEEEQDEFLEFAREALGISNDQWQNILSDRKSRGAFVPSHVAGESGGQQKKASPDQRVSFNQPSDNEPKLRQPIPGPRPNANPNLDSFEAVMQAMDAELARNRSGESKPSKSPQEVPAPKQDKGKGKEKSPPAEDVDIEAAMEAELNAALERGDDEDIDLSTESGMDYNLIKNFLESFKSQGGLSGPVSSLAGRLQPGYNLPRDK